MDDDWIDEISRIEPPVAVLVKNATKSSVSATSKKKAHVSANSGGVNRRGRSSSRPSSSRSSASPCLSPIATSPSATAVMLNFDSPQKTSAAVSRPLTPVLSPFDEKQELQHNNDSDMEATEEPEATCNGETSSTAHFPALQNGETNYSSSSNINHINGEANCSISSSNNNRINGDAKSEKIITFMRYSICELRWD